MVHNTIEDLHEPHLPHPPWGDQERCDCHLLHRMKAAAVGAPDSQDTTGEGGGGGRGVVEG